MQLSSGLYTIIEDLRGGLKITNHKNFANYSLAIKYLPNQ